LQCIALIVSLDCSLTHCYGAVAARPRQPHFCEKKESVQ
jgi:hypothetical protein